MPKELTEAETTMLCLMALILHNGGVVTLQPTEIVAALGSTFDMTVGPKQELVLEVRPADTAQVDLGKELAKDST